MDIERVVALAAFLNFISTLVNFKTALINNKKAKEVEESKKDTTPKE